MGFPEILLVSVIGGAVLVALLAILIKKISDRKVGSCSDEIDDDEASSESLEFEEDPPEKGLVGGDWVDKDEPAGITVNRDVYVLYRFVRDQNVYMCAGCGCVIRKGEETCPSCMERR